MASKTPSFEYPASNTLVSDVPYRLYVILFFFTFLIYGNSIRNGYCIDDEIVTYSNPVVRNGVRALPEIFTTHYYKDRKFDYGYRPIVKASFAIEYSLYGENLHLSHFWNVLMYSIACCLTLLLLVRLLGAEYLLFSFVVTLLFLVHPLHTEVVDSLKNRDVLFSYIFSITAFIFYLSYASTHRFWFLVAGTFSFFLASISKEDSVVYAILIPFSIFYFNKVDKTKLFVLSMGVVAVFLLFGLYKLLVSAPDVGKTMVAFENPLFFDNNFWNRIPVGFYSLGYYFRLLALPWPLTCYYGSNYVPLVGWHTATVIINILIVLFLLFWIIRSFQKRTFLVYGVIFFIIAISVFLNIISPIAGVIAERLAFNASLGFCVGVAALLFQIFNIKNEGFNLKPTFIFFRSNSFFSFFLSALLLLHSSVTIARNKKWKDIFTLTKADMTHASNSTHLQNLYAYACQTRFFDPGVVQQEKQQLLQDAIRYYSESLNSFPDQATVNNNLGTILSAGAMKYKEALPYFVNAVKLDSVMPEYYFNLGLTYEKLNNPESAVLNYQKAILHDSAYIYAYTAITNIYIVQMKIEEGLDLNNSAIERGIIDKQLYINLGSLLITRGDTAQAIGALEKSLELYPSNEGIALFVADYYRKKSNSTKESIQHKN